MVMTTETHGPRVPNPLRKIRATPLIVGERTLSFCVGGRVVEAGEVCELPIDDADRLVRLGKATYV